MNESSISIPSAELLLIDDIVDRFEDAWKRGKYPEIEEFLKLPDDKYARSPALILELCIIDLSARWRTEPDDNSVGKTAQKLPLRPRVEDYFTAFPELEVSDHPPLELMREEYVARMAAGEQVDVQQFADRFPKWTPRVKQYLLELASEKTAKATHDSRFAPSGSATKLDDNQILDDYEIIEQLATGGMGIVYRARQVSLNRLVALKTIRRGNFASEEEVQRFQTEAKMVATLDHPNIVPIFDVGHKDGQHYYSMALVDGESLAEQLRRGPFDAKAAAQICYELAVAIHYAHTRGIIHRDLKPSNILIDSNNKPRITDFGLAKQIQAESDLTRTGQVLGTPAFMPPEQADNARGDATERSDVYALGAVLYAMLTGRPPFQAQDPVATIREVLDSDPVLPRRLNGQIPVDLETICLQCLAKEPARRYASAEALANDLQRFIEKRPILAKPLSRPERLARWCRRNPSLATAVFVILVILLASTAGAFWYAVELAELAESEVAAKHTAVREQSRSLAASGVLRLQEGDTSGLHDLVDSLQVLTAQDGPVDQEAIRSRLRLTNAWLDEIPATIKAIFSHDQRLRDAVFSIDHKYVITATSGLEIRAWDAATSRPATSPLRHESSSTLMRLVAGDSPDTFLSIDHGGLTYLWSISQSATLASINGGDWNLVAAASECRFVAAADGTQDEPALAIYRAATLQKLYTIPLPKPIARLAIEPRESKVAVAMQGGMLATLELGDESATETGRTTIPPGAKQLQFSPSGQFLAVVGEDNSVNIWPASFAEPAASILHEEDVYALAFSNDERLFASGGFDSQLQVWNLQTNSMQFPPLRHDGPVLTAAFSSDGSKLVTGGYGANVNVWDPETGDLLSRLMQHQGVVQSVRFSELDSDHLLSASRDGTARLWQLKPRLAKTATLPHSDRVWSVDFSADGKKLVVACEDGDLHFWDTERNVEIRDPEAHPETLIAARFNHQSGDLVTANNDGSMRIWEIDGQTLQYNEVPLRQSFRDIEVSPNGEFVIAGCDSPMAYILDIRRKPYRFTALPHPAGVKAVACFPDSKTIATGCDDGIVRLWNAETGELIDQPIQHRGRVTAIAVSSDGAFFTSASEYGRTVQIWDCADWTPLAYAVLPKSFVQEMSFAPNNRILSTASGGEVTFWDIDSGLPCGLPIRHAKLATCLRFSKDGQWMASGGFDQSVELWRLPEWFDENDAEATRKRVWRSIGILRNSDGIERSLTWRQWLDLN